MVTYAGLILLISGALSVLFGIVSLSSDARLLVPGGEGAISEEVVAVYLVISGCLSLLAGWLVLRLRPAGRMLGILMATLGIATGLVQVGSTGGPGLLAIVLNAFVLYGLFTYGFVFKTGPSPG
ncbi:MAG: hypothetical protein H0T07_01025 [Actinobacteria bacterium]|nr:hypothetical protein [Actinomycetota bacterium]